MQSQVQVRLRGVWGGREGVEEVSRLRQALNLDQSKLSCEGFGRRQVTWLTLIKPRQLKWFV